LNGHVHRRGHHSLPTRRPSDLEKYWSTGSRSTTTGVIYSVRSATCRISSACTKTCWCGNTWTSLLAVMGSLQSGESESYRNCWRSEEHTFELQSRENLVCRLLL